MALFPIARIAAAANAAGKQIDVLRASDLPEVYNAAPQNCDRAKQFLFSLFSLTSLVEVGFAGDRKRYFILFYFKIKIDLFLFSSPLSFV